jgi:hypothetical protein
MRSLERRSGSDVSAGILIGGRKSYLVDCGELLRVFFAQVLVLKRRADLSAFKPKGCDPLGFASAMAELLHSWVQTLNFGVKVRQ